MKKILFLLLCFPLFLFSQNWNQIGQDIDGEAANDQSGSSVSISSDGNRIVIGAPENDGSSNASGHVRIYENINGSWSQIGQDIDGESTFDNIGYSVSISSDGNRVAAGATINSGNGPQSGHVRLYEWDGSSWTQMGLDIDGEASGDYSGTSVSISADGSKVAIGAPKADGTPGNHPGHVRIFNWDGSLTWNRNGKSTEFHCFFLLKI